MIRLSHLASIDQIILKLKIDDILNIVGAKLGMQGNARADLPLLCNACTTKATNPRMLCLYFDA